MTKKQKKVLIRIIISVLLMIVLNFIPVYGYVRFILYMIPYLIIGYDILRKAFKGIIKGQVFDENFLMAVATIGAIIIGEYTEGTAVMLFYQIGELFQSYAVGKSRRNISELMDIRPDYANIMQDDKLVKVDPDEVEPGSIIIVQPGEKCPIDGIVIEGSSSLNTSALTGESIPRDVSTGDEIISGCINMTGVLQVKTTKEFGESTVSKILDLVENATSKKSRSENFISRFARYYTPVVCYLALALAFVPPVINIFAGNAPLFSGWIYRALTFLVISCPCALVISIPLSFFAGIGGASREGVLVKGSSYLEALAKAGYVVFDKTGTVTEATFRVTEIYSSGMGEEELLRYAAYAESHSSHPISKSIKEAYGRDIDLSFINDIQEISGQGVIATLSDDTQICAGNYKLMKRQNIVCDETDKTGTVIYIAKNDVYAGYILISDVVKKGAKEAIRKLKKEGIKKTVMLTGDRDLVAENICAELGIDEVHAELLPDQKVSLLEKIIENKTGNGKVVYVGDGINDAPVLKRADIGIAMGALGSDAAIEAADVVLMDDDPLKIAKAIRIAKKCIRIVYENIYFAIGIKFICLILGAMGIANMWLAIFADVGVMVIAVLNAIRALFVKKL
ncbi:MAG: cadmium-translocating P-type ATPase [Lachnospiraceae bacterium]|nr:cadmium-translocating P-type ATPase [Lachnospiraceae bacterium]